MRHNRGDCGGEDNVGIDVEIMGEIGLAGYSSC